MLKRIVIGSLLIAVAVGLFLLDAYLERIGRPVAGADAQPIKGLPVACVMLVLIAAGYLEFARLAAGVGAAISRLPGMLATMLVGTWPFWRQLTGNSDAGGAELLAVLSVAVMIIFADQLARRTTADAIRRIGIGMLGVCYLGVCAAVMLEIRMRFGVEALVLMLLVIKFTDIGAYFTGTAIGKHKIAPWLSPGKSWEGLAGGLILAAAAGVGLVAMLGQWHGNPLVGAGPRLQMSLTTAAIFAVIVGSFGQAADMCESALKRDANMKDAGRSIPGFGGVLDLIDSPLLAGPVALILLEYIL